METGSGLSEQQSCVKKKKKYTLHFGEKFLSLLLVVSLFFFFFLPLLPCFFKTEVVVSVLLVCFQSLSCNRATSVFLLSLWSVCSRRWLGHGDTDLAIEEVPLACFTAQTLNFPLAPRLKENRIVLVSFQPGTVRHASCLTGMSFTLQFAYLVQLYKN